MRLSSCLFVLCLILPAAQAGSGMTFEDVAAMREVRSVDVSPDGKHVAYVLSVPRAPGVDDDGSAWSELHLVETASGRSRPFVHGEVSVSSAEFSPDGSFVTYLSKRGDDEKRSLWSIPVAGGESRRLLAFEEAIASYAISPDGSRVAFIATEPMSKIREKARKKGYKQEIYEEDWRPRRLYLAPIEWSESPAERPAPRDDDDEDEDADEPRAIEIEGSALAVVWSPLGDRLAVSVAPRPLVDDRYMLQTIRILKTDGTEVGSLPNPGKQGAFDFSPDGKRLAVIAAADVNDPNEGRLMLAPATGGAMRDLMPELNGHVTDFAWQDAKTLHFIADVGVQTFFGEIDVDNGRTKAHAGAAAGFRQALAGETGPPPDEPGPIFRSFELGGGGQVAAFVAHSPRHPGEVYGMRHGDPGPVRWTDSNPWLADVALGSQEVVVWTARDGLKLQGILIRPLERGEAAPPLILSVHGGPEAHEQNGWLTRYSRAGQLGAARGFAVFYPNYRGSTGRGVAFSKMGQADGAGKEFDDLVDAVDHLARAGLIDRERVGITGGSYGGFATAWGATRLTEHFKAGVMFVGISNKLSKSFTTDIPLENRLVHTLADPWDKFQFNLERSPLYYVEQGRTPLLIAGGTADTRVHPSQSLQLYRALKELGNTPVRYVRYPGEGHGNVKAAARDDYARRLIRWMEHYLMGPGGDPPPWDLEPLGGDDDDDDEEEEEEEEEDDED